MSKPVNSSQAIWLHIGAESSIELIRRGIYTG